MTVVIPQSFCPICNSRENRRFLVRENRLLLICCDCRHIYWNGIPDHQALAEYYRTTYAATHKQEQIQRNNTEYLKTHLKELIHFLQVESANAKIVDFGCSFPHLLIEARRSGFHQTIGVEWDQRAREMGEREGVCMLTPDAYQDTIASNSIDIIRFSHVLEHSIDPVAMVVTARQKLRRGGLIYITQPNFPVFACQKSALDIADAVWPEHLHFFCPVSLHRLIKKTGLEVRSFFTHQNSERVARKYIGQLDVAYSATQLSSLALVGDLAFGAAANYPLYAGENSVTYAVNPS